ncbi:MAG: glycine--tRNA ligase subunit beta [Anaerolineaceae bacterium]|nr:glycine--tRNA ligase subunit beta [Anaerolineaceae bacterium]MDD4042655.1 glycine--tRNA ligase subunit beta [Anaerolineaceae bacterium]MDD4577897.1 glycine--tRNA ligase subunit beta [Anaerolineaceae bacterium]
MNQGLDFQSIIFNLQTYWASQGCLIWQPYYSQLGAGTMNPATFLRVLGPEPWNVAYVEPSVRPDDGRYGINPNRLQQHHQFQVILKPDPGNPQELYLKSLLALGIDPQEHDIRFVEDNWESPALSAWGLGWEVWLDGQEITQFTYFQQAGGMTLDVPAVELTYGLERIAMTLQGVSHFKNIRWNDQRLYGDVYQIAEREHSTYYYEVADVPRLREMFNLFTREAENALAKGLVLPAYDNVIKCSHTFNVLDARGAIGFTERQALFSKMRDLSKKVAEAYYAQREEMGFPWLEHIESHHPAAANLLQAELADRADLLFEIGTEELPASELDRALEQLHSNFKTWLAETRLEYETLLVQGTPRRLTVMVKDLQTRQAMRIVELKGPPADRAFDSEGKPTKVAEGFARSKGLQLDQLKVKTFENGRYVVAEISEAVRTSLDLLTEKLPAVIGDLRFSKSMRWNQSGDSFSRPVRWILAILDDQVVPFEFAGLNSGNTTWGLRFSEQPSARVNSLAAYETYLEGQGIILDPVERKRNIWQQALHLAGSVNGKLADDPDLLAEIGNLVERPTALLGTFDQRYLQSLPPEVLIGVMKKHQRYIPVLDMDGNLTNHFIMVRNGGEEHSELVLDGNLQVILARFADAEFFVQEDLKNNLEDFVPRLSQLTFQKQLGSMLDKTERIEKLSLILAEKLGLDKDEMLTTSRIAQLCKADLASEMVVEMTSLQGVMGKYYARHSGESEAVSQGVFEHYLPRSAEDPLPASRPATVVGLADRLDSIAGLFAVGLIPTGNKDPFALRRAAIGLVGILLGKNIDFDTRWALQQAGSTLSVPFKQEVEDLATGFITGRLHTILLDQGFAHDVVDAVEVVLGENPARAEKAVEILTGWVGRSDWDTILPAFSRCVRMTRDLEQVFDVDPSLLVEQEEIQLYQAVVAAEESRINSAGFENALVQVEALVQPINAFFDKVLVMVEDQALRESRLGILQRIAGLMEPFADFSKLEGF